MTRLPKLKAASPLGLLLSRKERAWPQVAIAPRALPGTQNHGCFKTRPQGTLTFKITSSHSVTQLSTETTKPTNVISETGTDQPCPCLNPGSSRLTPLSKLVLSRTMKSSQPRVFRIREHDFMNTSYCFRKEKLKDSSTLEGESPFL